VTDRDDHLAEAVGELYSADPEDFTERRTALAARAKAAGDAGAARQIGGLRKPTRSAWVINQLARAEPGLAGQLTDLGDELRAAQDSLDGARMRELSARRRRLIDELAQQAFSAAGLPAPPAALRDEVTATLGAALADPELAGQLQAGTLVRAVQPGGFGPSPPSLTLLPGGAQATGGASRSRRAPGQSGRAGSAGRTGTAAKGDPAARAAAAAAEAEERERAAQERRRQIIAEAEQRMAEADQAAEAATSAESARLDEVERLEEQLSSARRALDLARSQARRARSAQRAARQALGRLRK
jgi:hypothetical protein